MSHARPLIVHVIHRLAIGGLENGLVNLINNLPAEEYRHAIVCLTDYTDFRARITRNNVEVYSLGQQPGHDISTHFRLYRLIRRLRPVIVHTRNLSTLEFQWVVALAGVRGRIHSEHGWDITDLHGTNWRHKQLRRITRPLIRRYVTVSQHLAQWLIDTIGVGQEAVRQIYNGVDLSRFRPDKIAARHRLPPSFAAERNFVIGTVGRLMPVKNQVLLLEAFVHLVRTSPELADRLRLVVVGDGNLSGRMSDVIAAAGLEKQVWLAGARNDVPELLQEMDLFVLSSLNEGISNTILEAMASGLPVVATDVGGNSELIEPGRTGALVGIGVEELAGAMKTYASNVELAVSHGALARQRVERLFNLPVMVDAYRRLYTELLAETRVRN